MKALNRIQLQTGTESTNKIVIFALFISKHSKGEPTAIIMGLRTLGALFIVGVGRMSVSSFDQTIVFSDNGAKFQFHMVQRVLRGTKLIVQMVTMRL